MLAKLVCPSDSAGAARSLAAYLPMLANIPDGAFTLQSLEAVARDVHRTPSYAELRAAIVAWWELHKPPQPALAGPGAKLNPMDWAWVRYWKSRDAEGFCAYGNSPGGRQHVAGLIRQHSPAAWAKILEEEQT